jgi:Tfp pilus assembly protein PilF
MLRFTLVSLGVLACVLAMLGALRIGQARALLTRNRSLASVTEAVQLSPHDPEVYRGRAAVLSNSKEFDLAVDDLRQAIALRPRDYKLWTELARVLNKQGNTSSALIAITQARSLAPFYYSVHWETGTLLEKLGRYEEAFAEFRAAALTAPVIRGPIMEKAWKAYDGNIEAIQRAMDPQTSEERLSLAWFFIRKQRPVAAMSVIRQIGDLSHDERKELLRQFLKAKQFSEAYEVWDLGTDDYRGTPKVGAFNDGGFESGQLSDEEGFTWIVDDIPGVSVSVDKQTAHSGASSVRINWNGAQNPFDKVISQRVLVNPNTRYQLNFAAITQDLTSGGAPVVTIIDVSEKNSTDLAQSSPLALSNTSWHNVSVDFATANSTRAIQIALRRQNCERPCPIFGTMWLDDFRLSER